MRYNAAIISLALAIAAAPSLAMPVPAGEIDARSEALEVRLNVWLEQQQRGLDALAGFGSAAFGGGFTALADVLSNHNQPSKRFEDLEARQVAGKVIEDGLKDVIGKNLVNGIGSALGATAIGGAIEHFIGQKNSRDLDFDHFENFFNHDLPVKRGFIQNIIDELFAGNE